MVETPNFVVLAPSVDLATAVGDRAESDRRRCAKYWFGHDVPAWKERCRITVDTVEAWPMRACEYVYEPDKGILRDFHFRLHGSPEEVRENIVHNVAHVLLAWHFVFPLPRWTESATELMDEDQESRIKRHQYVRRALAEKKAHPVEKLFAVEDYPTPFGAAQLVLDQGATVTEFLIDRADRKTYLAFVGHGKQRGWDQALQKFYELQDCKELESAWKDWLTANDPATALRVEEDVVAHQNCRTKGVDEHNQESPVPVQANARSAAFLPREQRLIGVWKPEPGQGDVYYTELVIRADRTGTATVLGEKEEVEWDLVDDELNLVRGDNMTMSTISVVALTRRFMVIHRGLLWSCIKFVVEMQMTVCFAVVSSRRGGGGRVHVS